MDAQFDRGEIIEVVRFPIEPFYNAGDLVRISHEHLTQLFQKYIPKLLKGKVKSYPQGEGKYYKKARIDDHVVLNGKQMLKIRAVTAMPKFCAVTDIGGKKYKIVPVQNKE